MHMTTLFAVGVLVIGSGLQHLKQATTDGQVAFQGSFELDASADKAILFFTPEGERAWAKGFDPKAVYPSQEGVAFQTNAVFRVDDGEERSLWTIIEADLRKHTAEYVYLVEGERLSRVRVEIDPVDLAHCRVRVRYVHTAISEKGLHFITGLSEMAFTQKMQDWRRAIGSLIR